MQHKITSGTGNPYKPVERKKHMQIKLVGMSNTANIYGVFDETGKRIATIESKLIGPNAGNHLTRFNTKYTRSQIFKAFRIYLSYH
jgi:hypothetical protein